MDDHSVAYVALDTSKLRNAVAIAEAGRDGEIRYLGEIDNAPAATAKLARRFAKKHAALTFAYEAGPTGYGLYRQIKSLGHDCIVVAPSLIPQKPGDRVKTNRRDALSLARQLRAGDLTAVWVPDPHHEAVRDLTRARGAAVRDQRAKRQQVSALLLRLGLHYPGKTTWGKAHMAWLAGQKLAHLEQRIALEEMLHAVRQAGDRIARLEQAIHAAVPDWSLAPSATALMALRGIEFIAATTLLAEIGDLTRFRTPRELMRAISSEVRIDCRVAALLAMTGEPDYSPFPISIQFSVKSEGSVCVITPPFRPGNTVRHDNARCRMMIATRRVAAANCDTADAP